MLNLEKKLIVHIHPEDFEFEYYKQCHGFDETGKLWVICLEELASSWGQPHDSQFQIFRSILSRRFLDRTKNRPTFFFLIRNQTFVIKIQIG